MRKCIWCGKPSRRKFHDTADPGPHFNPHENSDDLLDAATAGMTCAGKAAYYGHGHPEPELDRVYAEALKIEGVVAVRQCIECRRPFRSEGPGNRRCPNTHCRTGPIFGLRQARPVKA